MSAQNLDTPMGYIENLMKKIELPQEAQEALMAAGTRVFSDPALAEVFDRLRRDFYDFEIGILEALEELAELEESSGIQKYVLHFLYLVWCCEVMQKNYRAEGIPEEIFWDTVEDFRCKLLECYAVEGVWGTFVGTWYADFFAMSRFALGRFQYELVYWAKEPYTRAGYTVKKGDKAYNFHIPSSGKPFDKQGRLASYKRAYDFYRCAEQGKPLVLVCDSWLLYKGHEEFLPEQSNIRDFMRDFDILDSREHEEFKDAWRVFGKDAKLPPEQLPRNTSLQRAFADRLMAGKKTGSGYGVIVFDGENIL